MSCLRSPWPDPCSVLNPPGGAQQRGGARTELERPPLWFSGLTTPSSLCSSRAPRQVVSCGRASMTPNAYFGAADRVRLKTANLLGITIPDKLLALADEVTE